MGNNPTEDSGKLKVLYIAGWGRTGSTLLDNILGQIDGFFSVGELRLWSRRFMTGQPCGCGASLKDCDVWKPILEKAYGPDVAAVAKEMYHSLHDALFLIPWLKTLSGKNLDGYVERLARLYTEIRKAVGCRVVVDSSKFPPYGHALSMIPGIELFVVHLVRDPRAVAYSWRRQAMKRPEAALKNDPLYSRRNHPVVSSLKWSASNFLAETLWKMRPERYALIRYEDFASDPQGTVRRIISLVGERCEALPFRGDFEVEMRKNHTVSGNPVRFRSGAVKIKLDDEWKLAMDKSDRFAVDMISRPYLLKYGYSG